MAGVTALKAIFSVLGCAMVATLIYTISVDGSPFRKELLVPWMTATLIDFYINVAAISAWVIYKESSWISAFIWVALLICFGSANVWLLMPIQLFLVFWSSLSIMTCAYIVKELFKLSPQDPAYLILIRDSKSLASVILYPEGEMMDFVLSNVRTENRYEVASALNEGQSGKK